MTGDGATPRRLHRAIILGVLITLSVAWLAVSVSSHLGALDWRGWIALSVVLVGAAIAGVAFSWGRYYK